MNTKMGAGPPGLPPSLLAVLCGAPAGRHVRRGSGTGGGASEQMVSADEALCWSN